MRSTFILAVLLAIGGASCVDRTPTVRKYVIGPDRKPILVAQYPGTEDDGWKELVDERISEELAGKPEGVNWEDFWRRWYRNIRTLRKPVMKSSIFQTTEDMVTYIKQRRAERGLPVYDP